MQLKTFIDKYNVDIDLVCVDSYRTRDILTKDNKYGITEVPTIITVYENGQYKKYTDSKLDTWFKQLYTNMQKLQTSQRGQTTLSNGTTPLTFESQTVPQQTFYNTNNLPPIETNQAQSIQSIQSIQSGMGNSSAAQRAMIQEHIKPPESNNSKQPLDAPVFTPASTPAPVPVPSGVKQEGVSARELSKQIEEERAKLDEDLENNKPFI